MPPMLFALKRYSLTICPESMDWLGDSADLGQASVVSARLSHVSIVSQCVGWELVCLGGLSWEVWLSLINPEG